MKVEIRNQVTMLRRPISAEMTSSGADRRRWMVIYPTMDEAVLLVEFEHLANADTDGWFGPGDVLNRRESQFENIDALISDLNRRGVDTDVFDVPWKMDFPL